MKQSLVFYEPLSSTKIDKEISKIKDLESADKMLQRIQKQYGKETTISLYIKYGKLLKEIKRVCEERNRNFYSFLTSYKISSWSKSFICFLLSLNTFSERYLKMKYLTIGVHFVKKHLKKFKSNIELNDAEVIFWNLDPTMHNSTQSKPSNTSNL